MVQSDQKRGGGGGGTIDGLDLEGFVAADDVDVDLEDEAGRQQEVLAPLARGSGLRFQLWPLLCRVCV